MADQRDQDGGMIHLKNAIELDLGKGVDRVYPIFRDFADGLFPDSEESLISMRKWAEGQGWRAVFLRPSFSVAEDVIGITVIAK